MKRKSYFHKIRFLFILAVTAMLYSCDGVVFNCGSFPFAKCEQAAEPIITTLVPEPAAEPSAENPPPDAPDPLEEPSQPVQEPIRPLPEPPISEPLSPPATLSEETTEANLPTVPILGVDSCTWDTDMISDGSVGSLCGCSTDWEGNRENMIVVRPGVCGVPGNIAK